MLPDSGFERLESATIDAEFEEVVLSIGADDDRHGLLTNTGSPTRPRIGLGKTAVTIAGSP
jgi:hypothetical protein